jgi:hypothetical protein
MYVTKHKDTEYVLSLVLKFLLCAQQKPIGEIEVLGSVPKNLHSIMFSRLLFLFELE